MARYKCEACGYIYDSEKNNDMRLEDLPDSWKCPMCGVTKDHFA